MNNQFKTMSRINDTIAQYVFYRGGYIISYSVEIERIKIKLSTGKLYNETVEFYRVDDIETEIQKLKAERE